MDERTTLDNTTIYTSILNFDPKLKEQFTDKEMKEPDENDIDIKEESLEDITNQDSSFEGSPKNKFK